jgi:lysine 2,3-aminomutase
MVDPGRVSDDFIAALLAPGATTWVAIHANHAKEFSGQAKQALARLADAGIPLISQSVLLKGVNDNVETLAALMRAFLENRVKPYYLHHPDLARGTSHFRVSIEDGLALTRALRAQLSGLAQPSYVLDIPGGFGKVPLDSAHVEKTASGHRIRDHAGDWHDYPPLG